MAAFVLIVIAIASRLLPHAGWFNFTAVGGSLLYLGARGLCAKRSGHCCR